MEWEEFQTTLKDLITVSAELVETATQVRALEQGEGRATREELLDVLLDASGRLAKALAPLRREASMAMEQPKI